MRRLIYGILAFAAAMPAAVIGKSAPPPPLTVERVSTLPAKERAAWVAYLERSKKQRRADQAALEAEMKGAGLANAIVPPGGSAARSVPLNRPAEWYGGAEARRIAAIVVSFQTPAGGWSKNLNMADHERRKGEHFASDNVSRFLAPGDFDTPHDIHWSYVGTIDNDATTTQLQFLARVVSAVGGEEAAPYRASFLRGVRYLLEAQYPNGGWPQVYPLDGGYHDAITFNDGAIIGAMRVLSGVAEGKGDYAFTPTQLREEARHAVECGIECILKTQVVVDGKLTVWGQQHDVLTLKPVAARNYEMVALCSSESAGIVEFLMGLPDPSPRVVKSVEAAAAWFRKTAIADHRYVRDRQRGARLEAQPGAPALWARYYEIGSDRPLFGDRDQSIHDTLAEISMERQNGYSWYNSGPAAVLSAMAGWERKR